ncbi:MAG: homocysteine S-methyltransferase [Desulforhopalus sp.]|jgi:homocysteine S-methyltransferase
MNPIQKILNRQPVLILDGALSTELERRGCDLKDPLWSAKVLIENPERIAAVHEDYYHAGADCVITASYQATFEGFIKRGLSEEEAEELITTSVSLAREVRDAFWEIETNRVNRARPLVAASVGPYGAYLADGSEYRGNYGLDEEALLMFHKKRFETLIEAGPDILACETIPCLVEAKALVRLLAQTPGVYCWICFSAGDGAHINSGERIADCARWLNQYEQVAAIGVNCTAPEHIEPLIENIRSQTNKPVIVYSNGGFQYDAVTKTWLHCSSTNLAYGERSLLWYKKGAQLIGGCCQTTPGDIRKIANWVRPLKQ